MAFATSNIIPHLNRSSNGDRSGVELANLGAAFAMNRALSSAAAAIGTTTQKVKTAATLTYTINGIFFSKAATDDFWTLAGTTVAASMFQKYLLLIDSAGAASIQEGVQANTAAKVGLSNVSNYSAVGALLSILNAGKVVAVTLQIATDSTHTFVPGTTALNAAGITATYNNGLDQAFVPLIANGLGTLIGNGA